MNTEQIDKVRQAMLYIRTHLDRPLSLQEVAEVAGFSPYHFHRIFHIAAGETLHRYVKRVRLETAAQQLRRDPGTPVTAIAERCGFSSAANFSRAFQERFGLAPTRYRKSGAEPFPVRAEPGAELPPLLALPEAAPHIEVRSLPPVWAACMPLQGVRGGTFDTKAAAAFSQLLAWHQQQIGAADSAPVPILCSGEDNWHRLPGRFAYEACVTVPAPGPGRKLTPVAGDGTQDIRCRELPGGLYAVCRVEKSASAPSSFAEAIREITWASEYMYIHWIPEQGYELDDRPGMHRFYSGPADPRILMECCLPIAGRRETVHAPADPNRKK